MTRLRSGRIVHLAMTPGARINSRDGRWNQNSSTLEIKDPRLTTKLVNQGTLKGKPRVYLVARYNSVWSDVGEPLMAINDWFMLTIANEPIIQSPLLYR